MASFFDIQGRETERKEKEKFRRKKSLQAKTKMAGSSFVWMMMMMMILGLQLQVEIARAQNQTNGTTPAAEVDALNSILRKWGVSASNQFEITEPCVGFATNDSISLGNGGAAHNPGFKCKCDGTVCHITGLKVYEKGVAGQIPDELWSLAYLTELNLGKNNLTGPVSPSIGNLTRMQYMNLDHNSFSGKLPKELGNLTELLILAFSSNNFSGPLPSELGKLTKLEHLRFWGNSLEGPIPSTFSNLNALEDLRISDLANGGSSLAFLKNMKSLKVLVLRNNNISGSILSNIGDYQNLSHLSGNRRDLSFWEDGGHYYGSRALEVGEDGTSTEHSHYVIACRDLSYNELSGSFPSWINQTGLQLNLVANNFIIGPTNDRIELSPKELSLQPQSCHTYLISIWQNPLSTWFTDNFSVKCGGPETISNQIIYERDNETLGPATYYVSSTNRWAVSNVGRFGDNNNSIYTSDSSSPFFANNPELFKTARISPASLRYYGLGLVNGNYTVSLQFAEITILNSPTGWESLGRRVFDIYIQGNLVLKDFDIKKEADGNSFQAVPKNFPAQVSDNYLEIHLFWAGKGTCCIPTAGTYGPSISAISVTRELLGIDARPYTFSYAELKAATADFNPANKLGEGGFGPVFKGTLNDGRVIAVKQLSVASHQGKSQFVAEIATISAVQQRNLVKLYGCCIEGEKRILVYEYLENKSLDQALFAGKTSLYLDWPTRFDICLGVARGLAYLHEESRLRIVHRDVKASNILLDSDLNPKISDFGLAKLYDDKKTHISTRVAGTIGYLAPEYAMRGHLTEKADVFGFGVVALEVVSGRPNSDTSLEAEKMYLLDWAWHLHQNNNEVELVDANLSEFNKEEVKRLIRVALLCTQSSPQMRPSMSRAVAMLLADVEVGAVTAQPGYLMSGWKFNDTTSFMSTDTQTTKTDYSHYSSSSSTRVLTPDRDSKPMLQEIIGE
ncbi:hypothetical protein RHMOL_Rhmol10G0054700 [Rhododendron molle]|uniref:Uncharacterized protein n=1 Tax=Rhododendron molle TaxID=49168 RepID=A0ACC0LZ74_RHOML|nr:hypothetical protein RHMOL_Rhmol10G0054700 [Rhododendron molle]